MPQVVFVKFHTSEGADVDWQLEGTQEPGLYPIVPKRSSWYLDKGRANPVLRIRRQQLPLAPAFAVTSHAAQGQTFSGGAIVDLRIGAGTNPLGSYVAMTRVQSRDKLLIYRPFSRALFSQGQREGPELLIRLLRGEQIDWQAIEERYMPKACCSGCGFVRYKPEFLPGQ
eukprot:12411803-Karenia_brevis.AAC.1